MSSERATMSWERATVSWEHARESWGSAKSVGTRASRDRDKRTPLDERDGKRYGQIEGEPEQNARGHARRRRARRRGVDRGCRTRSGGDGARRVCGAAIRSEERRVGKE